LDVIENTVRLLKRTSRRHDVIEDEAAFVESWKQTRSKLPIRKKGNRDQQDAKNAKNVRMVQRAAHPLHVEANNVAENTMLGRIMMCAMAANKTRAEVACPDQRQNERRQQSHT